MQTGTKKQNKTVRKKKSTKSKGLGDTIAKVTKVTGIEKVVKFIAGEDCGCEERRIKLNKLFPYNKPECLQEQEYTFLKEFFKLNKTSLTEQEQIQLIQISNRVLHTKREISNTNKSSKEEKEKGTTYRHENGWHR